MRKAGGKPSSLPSGHRGPGRLLLVTQCDVRGQPSFQGGMGEGGQLNVLWPCAIPEGFSTAV